MMLRKEYSRFLSPKWSPFSRVFLSVKKAGEGGLYQLSFFFRPLTTKKYIKQIYGPRIRPFCFFFLNWYIWYTRFFADLPLGFCCVCVFFLGNASRKNRFHVAKGRRFPFQQSEAMCHCIEISRGRGRGWGRTSG